VIILVGEMFYLSYFIYCFGTRTRFTSLSLALQNNKAINTWQTGKAGNVFQYRIHNWRQMTSLIEESGKLLTNHQIIDLYWTKSRTRNREISFQ